MATEHYAIDLAAPRRLRATPWGAALLLVGLLVSVWTGLTLHSQQTRQAEAEATLARLEAALADRGAARHAAATRVPTAMQQRAQAELSRLAGDLFRPWFPMLDALETSAVPKVSLQQLSVDAGFTKLQLRVDAADLPEVLQYVHALDTAGAPLQAAALLGHEWQAAQAGAPRRLLARISVGLVPMGMATALPSSPPGSVGCGADPAMRCLSAKAAP
jgi:hypothetical protein